MSSSHKREVYLDHAATTPVDSAVIEAMLPAFQTYWGNPSSLYERGRAAQNVLQEAREQVARVLHCRPTEIIFNSGGSEGDNLALKGVGLAARLKGQGNHIITTEFEHHAILHAAEYLEQFGIETTYVPVNSAGLVEPAEIERAIRPGQTVLISVMYVNNEIGTIQPLAEISALARRHNIVFHTDAVQAPGHLSLDVDALGIDLLSLSSHKFYGPKGVGIFYVRNSVEKHILWQQQGGSQEKKRRAGTENVPYIVGTARALTLAEANRADYVPALARLRDQLLAGILDRIPGVHLHGTYEPGLRMVNNINLAFEGIHEEGILQALDLQGIAASNGSACNVGAIEPSHVIKAIGGSADLALGTLRLTLGKSTTEADIAYVLGKLPLVVSRMRALSEVAV